MFVDEKTLNKLYADTEKVLFTLNDKPEAVRKMMEIISDTPEYLQLTNLLPTHAQDDPKADWWKKPEEFTYLGNSFAAYSEAEFDRLVHILHGKVFDGVYHNSLVLWGYRMNWKCLAEEEWNGIKANVHLSFLGNSPVKIQIEQEKHVVTIYKKCDNNNRI